jgi:signal transduction histidine kinase
LVDRGGDWRDRVLMTLARVLAIVGGAPVLVGLISDPEKFVPFLPFLVLLIGGALWAGFSPSLATPARAWLLGIPLVLAGTAADHRLGPTAGVGLIFALVAVMFGLTRGARWGYVLVIVTTGLLVVAGVAGQPGWQPYVARESATPAYWIRSAVIYGTTAALAVFAVTRAVERVQAHEQRLRLALDAASMLTFRAHGAALEWDAPGAFPRALPATVEELLSWVPDGQRATAAAWLRGEAGAGVVHRLEPPGGQPMWIEAHARRVVVGRDTVVVGTIVDVTAREARAARRAEVQRTLWRLSSSPASGRGDLEAAVREITEAGARVLDVERCGVWRLSEDGGELRCLDLYVRGAARHERLASLRADAFPAYFAALGRGRALAAGDARSDERTRELGAAYLEPLGVAALLDAPVLAGGVLVGAICHEHVGTAPRPWREDEESDAGSLADCVARAFEASERVAAQHELERAYGRLMQLTRRLEAAKEEERRRIARELHDELGQLLTATKLNVQLAVGDRARARELLELLDRAISSTRELSRRMRPPLLDEVGLVAALQAFLEEQGRYTGLRIELAAPAVGPRLAPEVEIAAFRIVQEALTNVARHAAASRVEVSVARGAEALSIVVRDDGRGFDPAAAEEDHLGLVGMRERARALGGTLELRSSPGAGTEVRVMLPVVTAEAA